METIGKVLKKARVRKRFSQARLEKETKIKREFIEAVEKEEWKKLPEFPVVLGFVKNLGRTLALDQKRVVALLRRDYPPRSLRINPKPDVSDKFIWSPRFTFVVGVAVVVVIILGYLSFQYKKFISPPNLEVYEPAEGETIIEQKVFVLGITDPDAVIKINNQLVLVSEEGEFEAEIEIFKGTEELVIRAVSRSGKETIIRRKIIPELE